jgi:hypothetical protein
VECLVNGDIEGGEHGVVSMRTCSVEGRVLVAGI